MSDSRNKILNGLRRQFVPLVDLPENREEAWSRYADPLTKFAEMVAFSGASCATVQDIQDVLGKLQSNPDFSAAKRVLSLVDAVPGNVDLGRIVSPHELEDLDYVICQGDFAVAENGAVWVTDRGVPHRVCYFITQFLVVLVRAGDIIHNMHEAYEKMGTAMPGFGLFLAGPSKTADIEQSLVIGAHGCRELQVFILE